MIVPIVIQTGKGKEIAPYFSNYKLYYLSNEKMPSYFLFSTNIDIEITGTLLKLDQTFFYVIILNKIVDTDKLPFKVETLILQKRRGDGNYLPVFFPKEISKYTEDTSIGFTTYLKILNEGINRVKAKDGKNYFKFYLICELDCGDFQIDYIKQSMKEFSKKISQDAKKFEEVVKFFGIRR